MKITAFTQLLFGVAKKLSLLPNSYLELPKSFHFCPTLIQSSKKATAFAQFLFGIA